MAPDPTQYDATIDRTSAGALSLRVRRLRSLHLPRRPQPPAPHAPRRVIFPPSLGRSDASPRRARPGGRDRPDPPLPSPRLPSLPGTQAYEAYKNQANKPPGDGSGAEPPPEDDPDVRRYGKVGKRVWTKDAHGAPTASPRARAGRVRRPGAAPGRAPRDVDPGYEKPATGPTTNFVGNHMTQGAIDLAQNALSRPDPDAEARLARLEAARGVHRKPPQKLPPALPPPIDPIDETDDDAPNVGSKNVGSKEDVRRRPRRSVHAWRDGGDRVFVTLEPRRHLPPGADLDAAEARFERDAVTLEVPVRDDDARRPGRLLPGPARALGDVRTKNRRSSPSPRSRPARERDRPGPIRDDRRRGRREARAREGRPGGRVGASAPRGAAGGARRREGRLAGLDRPRGRAPRADRRREGRLAERMPWLREPAPALPEPETDDAIAASEEGDDDERPWEDVEAEVFAEAEEAARRGAHDEAEAAWSRALSRRDATRASRRTARTRTRT